MRVRECRGDDLDGGGRWEGVMWRVEGWREPMMLRGCGGDVQNGEIQAGTQSTQSDCSKGTCGTNSI